jgi:Cu(I)/Ag(I) efflux system membrane fusion protein
MKKNLLIIGFVLLSGLMFNSCGNSSSKEKQTTTKEVAKVQYTCPMHSEVVSDKPGNCPKCGMALVEKK